jgi:hypothetical protein
VVVLEGLSATVRGPRVGLHDQSLLAPEEVDGESTDGLIHLGLWDSVTRREGRRVFAGRW